MKVFFDPNNRDDPEKTVRQAQDYAKYGKLSAAEQVRENTGKLVTNDETITHALNRMTDKERTDYMRGKELADKKEEPKTKGDKEAKDYYDKLHKALDGVHWYTHDADMARWEDSIANKEGGIVSKVGAHRGSVYNDDASEIRNDIEGMNRNEWTRLHNLKEGNNADGSKPANDEEKKRNTDQYQHNRDELKKALDGLHGPRVTDADIKQAMDMFDKKMDAKDFKASEDVRRPLETALQDNKHFYGNDRAAMVNDIAKMTPEEQKKYREDKEYRKSIDD